MNKLHLLKTISSSETLFLFANRHLTAQFLFPNVAVGVPTSIYAHHIIFKCKIFIINFLSIGVDNFF